MPETPKHGPRLHGRKILITGAGSGIGKATAALFESEGARLALFDLRADGLRHAFPNERHVAVAVDVSDSAAVEAAVGEAASALGGLDGIVNAAGIFFGKPVAETSDADWHRVLGVHLHGPFFVCRAAMPHLRRSGRATIVNFTSVGALRPRPNLGAYATAKSGLVTLTKVLAAEEAPVVRANVISPGVVFTPMVQSVMGTQQAVTDIVKQRNAMQRYGEPEEIAQTALFLSSEASSFVTGSIISVDGGEAYH